MNSTYTTARHTALMRETHRGHWNDASNNVFVEDRDSDAVFSTRCGIYEVYHTAEMALDRAEQFLAPEGIGNTSTCPTPWCSRDDAPYIWQGVDDKYCVICPSCQVNGPSAVTEQEAWDDWNGWTKATGGAA